MQWNAAKPEHLYPASAQCRIINDKWLILVLIMLSVPCYLEELKTSDELTFCYLTRDILLVLLLRVIFKQASLGVLCIFSHLTCVLFESTGPRRWGASSRVATSQVGRRPVPAQISAPLSSRGVWLTRGRIGNAPAFGRLLDANMSDG